MIRSQARQEAIGDLEMFSSFSFINRLSVFFIVPIYLFLTDDNQSKDNKEENSNCTSKKEDKIDKLKRAAVTTLSAAAVKAKLLANQEEDQIRQLAMILIEKQVSQSKSVLSFNHSSLPSLSTNIFEKLPSVFCSCISWKAS